MRPKRQTYRPGKQDGLLVCDSRQNEPRVYGAAALASVRGPLLRLMMMIGVVKVEGNAPLDDLQQRLIAVPRRQRDGFLAFEQALQRREKL